MNRHMDCERLVGIHERLQQRGHFVRADLLPLEPDVAVAVHRHGLLGGLLLLEIGGARLLHVDVRRLHEV